MCVCKCAQDNNQTIFCGSVRLTRSSLVSRCECCLEAIIWWKVCILISLFIFMYICNCVLFCVEIHWCCFEMFLKELAMRILMLDRVLSVLLTNCWWNTRLGWRQILCDLHNAMMHMMIVNSLQTLVYHTDCNAQADIGKWSGWSSCGHNHQDGKASISLKYVHYFIILHSCCQRAVIKTCRLGDYLVNAWVNLEPLIQEGVITKY